MKSITILVIAFILASACYSQGVFTNDVNSALQKVIQDYPNHFANLKGSQVPGTPLNDQYHSTVSVPGAVKCMLTRYKAEKKEIYTWKCIMLEAQSFATAKGKYTDLYNQIRNTIVKMEGEKPFILNGKYETPSDDRKFTSVIFELLPATGSMQKLKVDLTLEQEMDRWIISLAVYDVEHRKEGASDLTNRD